ncbi:UNVERIFIED_CONTAM: hypothetical protein FKN15_014100 [Acipenser sinensis]
MGRPTVKECINEHQQLLTDPSYFTADSEGVKVSRTLEETSVEKRGFAQRPKATETSKNSREALGHTASMCRQCQACVQACRDQMGGELGPPFPA